MMIKVILTFLFIASCAPAKPAEDIPQAEPVLAEEQRDDLRAKLDLYLELSAELTNEYGFIEKCDALLFSGLAKVAGSDVDIEAAEEDGRWYRRPEKECYDNGQDDDPDTRPGSDSDISKDMYIGLLWATWYDRDLERIERAISYGKKELWIVGRGGLSKVRLSTNLRNTMSNMAIKLGSKEKYPVLSRYPMAWSRTVKDFGANLQVLHILLRAKIFGKIDSDMLKRVKEQTTREPTNALFLFAYEYLTTKDYTKTAEILLDEKYFPNDRLPTGADRCEDYLWQRDTLRDGEPNKDYLPCATAKGRSRKHNGIDYTLLAKLILEEFED